MASTASFPVAEDPPATSSGQAHAFIRLAHRGELDGLRGVAILCVVAGHFLHHRLNVTDLQLGSIGVSLFFALSGYLIASLLMAEKNRTSDISFKSFYFRRSLRLWPALLVYLALLAFMQHRLGSEELPWSSWLLSFFYLRNLAGHGQITTHLWSLSLEEQFYLVWPGFLKLVSFRVATIATTLAILAVSLFRTIVAVTHPEFVLRGYIYFRPWYRADTILSGCLIALLCFGTVTSVPGQQMVATIRRIPAILWWVLLLLSGLVLYQPVFMLLILILCFLAVCSIVLRPQDSLSALFRTKPLRLLGEYSYSIYLWQQVFLVVDPDSAARIFGRFARGPLSWVTFIVLSIASRQLIELPFLRLRNRQTFRRNTLTAAPQ